MQQILRYSSNGVAMHNISYSVVIRTFNSEKTLLATLDSLQSQTIAPEKYIFVDSGSTDGTLLLLPPCSLIHRFIGSEFNYSESLNQGINYVATNYVLIISSHNVLCKNNAVEYALNLLSGSERIGAAYFSQDRFGEFTYKLIDQHSFDGFNGLHNTASIIKVALLRRRSFRPEVFSAEDQEWASWLFHNENKAVACILGAGIQNNNPRRFSLSKRLNEYVAIAYFANRKLLRLSNIFRIAYRVVKPSYRLPLAERLFNLLLFFRLLACYFVKPKYNSRYL